MMALRRQYLPRVHRALEPLGGYAQLDVEPREYVGVVEQDADTFAGTLQELGFSPEPVAALKKTDDDRYATGSWVRRDSVLADEQFHVTLFDCAEDGRTRVYAHWEQSWIRHPVRHYRAEGWQPERGVATMRELLEEHDIAYRAP